MFTSTVPDGCESDDDASEISDVVPLISQTVTSGGTGGSIRMEGWLNHTTSSLKNQGTASSSGSSSASTTSKLSKTVSKKKRRAAKKKSPRYFVLRGSTLSYYARRHDVKAKGTFVLSLGCTVGPVLYGSLDDPISSMEEVTGEPPIDEFPSSPNYNASASDNFTEQASNSRSKKKKRRFYCIQITWQINDKPTKDEKYMAQAKAQVAAESEKEAMQQHELEHSSEDNASIGMATSNNNNNGNKSPLPIRTKQLLRRNKSEGKSQSPRKAALHQQQQQQRQSSSARDLDNNLPPLPPDLFAPDLNGDHNDQQQQQQMHGLLPAPAQGNGLLQHGSLNTPASALSGMNAFNRSIVESESASAERNNSAASTTILNHETGLHKHYSQQIEKHAKDQQKSAEELQKVMLLLSRKASHQKTKKRVIMGTKVAAASTAAITAGVLTAGIGLAAGLVFVGIAAAAGGSGAVVGSKMFDKARGKYHQHQSQRTFHLIIAATTYEEAMRWKVAMEQVVKELVLISKDEEEDIAVGNEWRVTKKGLSGGGGGGVGGDDNAGGEVAAVLAAAPSSPKTPNDSGGVDNGYDNFYHDVTPKWVPIQGGGMALWGILGALGGGNLRIYREERSLWPFSETTSAFPTIPRFRSDVGFAGQPFPPFKSSIVLKANSLDAFMCLMCSGRIHDDEFINYSTDGIDGPVPIPNSGQVASFRIIDTINDHMDVIHLVFRPLYLFPSWTAPRDFVLYRFWKYDDDGSYQICFDSALHRDCPPVTGYVRGEMHSVYTIAPLKKKKKKRGKGTDKTATATAASTTAAAAGIPRPNLENEECLMSHTTQINPRGWVPHNTSSLPFFRNQGYGDAFAIMALHQMLDVKEALDSVRFVAVTVDGTQGNVNFGGRRGFRRRAKRPRRLLTPLIANKGGVGSGSTPRSLKGLERVTTGGSPARREQQIFMPTLETGESGDISEDEEPDYSADYDFKYSGRHMDSNKDRVASSSIAVIPPPTM